MRFMCHAATPLARAAWERFNALKQS
jgi:hypothetical protein